MKTFYYLYGIITALFAFTIMFDLYAPEFIDEYWLNILYDQYSKEWWYSNVIVSVLFIVFTLIWTYHLGKGITEKEPLLIKKEEDNE